MEALTFSDRIGVSTLCLKGIPLAETIDQVLEAGFLAFEITPITYGGPEAFGRMANYPLLMSPGCQTWSVKIAARATA